MELAVIDRGLRRARGILAADESLLASVLGVIEGTRRRRVLVLTDRRLLMVPLRPAPPVSVSFDDLQDVELVGPSTLALNGAEGQHVLDKIHDPSGLRILLDLIASQTNREIIGREMMGHVRTLQG